MILQHTMFTFRVKMWVQIQLNQNGPNTLTPKCVAYTTFMFVLFRGSWLEIVTSVGNFDFANYVEVCCLSANRRVQRRPQAEGLLFSSTKTLCFL